ncbi:hypothetical protein A3Q56_05854 [Intoshia linei]|uniref:long-chain-fatty-acid--CoA ligase n=1 Tax=Intoshia linei TaxID=1819745 RepID=A0A177AWR0_9BILA|nr:hypothetical protein A3Q56_05854 [Intoshia linei]
MSNLKYFTSNLSDEVKLRDDDNDTVQSITIPQLLDETIERLDKGKTALMCQDDIGEPWNSMSFKDYKKNIHIVAKSLLSLDVKEMDSVGIIGFNDVYWHLSYLAAIHCGAVSVGIYTTNSPSAIKYCLNIADCKVIIVETCHLLENVRKIVHETNIIRIILINNDSNLTLNENEILWKDFILYAQKNDLQELLEKRINSLKFNKCCSIVFTSGTTGFPKAAMLTHDNLIWTSKKFSSEVTGKSRFIFGKEKLISYLPLSHIAPQLLDIVAPILLGSTVYFAQPSALKGTLSQTLREVTPTIFLGVPRVFEKIEEKIIEQTIQKSENMKKIFKWTQKVGLNHYKSNKNYFKYKLSKKLILNKIRKALGFQNCKYIIYGAAPIKDRTLNFFVSLNIYINGIYGMSETCGPQTIMVPGEFDNYSVGRAYHGTRTRINENQEIEVYGRNIFMGYKDNHQETIDAFTNDFYLKTGDQGAMDSKTKKICIIGRLKEILITSGGENIAVKYIENTLLKELPILSNAVVVGDDKKYLTVILTLKTITDMVTMLPTDDLTIEAVEWLKKLGSKNTKSSAIYEGTDTITIKAIEAGIQRTNEQSINRPSKIQRWTLLKNDFSIKNDELTPTMKLKRNVILKKYNHIVEALYQM